MRPEEFYLRDIILACEAANRFVSDITQEFFESSDLYRSAVLFKLMIVGEASSRISKPLKSRYPDVDWQSISGFRNIIAHEYFSLDLDVVWETARAESLILVQQVGSILRSEYPDFPLLDSQ